MVREIQSSPLPENEIGYLVRSIEPMPGLTLEQATDMAIDRAKTTGHAFGVFRLHYVALPMKKAGAT